MREVSVMLLLTTLLLTFTMSFDDFILGLSFGANKIKIPFRYVLTISIVSVSTNIINMIISKFVNLIIIYYKFSSSLLIIALGAFIVIKSFRKGKVTEENKDSDSIQEVNLLKLIYIGMALGFDDFTETLAIAAAGYSVPLFIFCLAIWQIININLGMNFGYIKLSNKITQKLSYIPGFIIILVGVWKLF